MPKTVTMSDETYERLVECKGHLVMRYKKPQSFDDVISELIARYQQSIFFGHVKTNEGYHKEQREIQEELKGEEENESKTE